MSRLHLTSYAIVAALVLLGGLAACAPLATINALSPATASTVNQDLAYGAGPRNKLDIYLPREAKGPRPVVVFFYGGNWISGDRASYAFVGRALAARGYVVVIPDYRLYPEVSYPAFLDDTAAAMAWTRREIIRYGGDPARLFVMGHSAGAYNAAMMALDPRYAPPQAGLRGWIGMAGPYDFIPVVNPTTRKVFHHPDTPPASQPIRYATANTPPALLIAANSDELVNPQRNTGGMARALRAQGVPVTELYYDGVNHTTLVVSLAAPLRLLAPTLDAVQQFIDSDGGRSPARP